MENTPHFITKYFQELTLTELYELLRVRADIFVVEQNCVYQDLDGIDYKSLHVFSMENGQVTACLRIFRKDETTAQIGRVLTRHHGTGLGGAVLAEGIRQAALHFHSEKLYLEAQVYAIGYYQKYGFQVCSEEFMLDGIPHVEMERKMEPSSHPDPVSSSLNLL